MPSFTKQKSTLHLLLTNSDQATAHGGQVLVDALCRRFGLWKRIHQTPSLDPRKRTGAGFSDRKSTRLNSSHLGISYAVFCLKKKIQHSRHPRTPPPSQWCCQMLATVRYR